MTGGEPSELKVPELLIDIGSTGSELDEGIPESGVLESGVLESGMLEPLMLDPVAVRLGVDRDVLRDREMRDVEGLMCVVVVPLFTSRLIDQPGLEEMSPPCIVFERNATRPEVVMACMMYVVVTSQFTSMLVAQAYAGAVTVPITSSMLAGEGRSRIVGIRDAADESDALTVPLMT